MMARVNPLGVRHRPGLGVKVLWTWALLCAVALGHDGTRAWAVSAGAALPAAVHAAPPTAPVGGTAGRATAPARPAVRAHAAAANPLAGRGMWIWVLRASNGGDVGSIAAQAKRYGVSTLMIKAGDGSSTWSQFNSGLVSALHARGLRVCAWQYVYGTHPVSEAYVGAAAVKAGADCLLIDAESEYQGRYVQAQTYINQLRSLIGSSYPLALAGLPYVDYHPGFPYSVFLGPGGAKYNVPQMYWVDIGTTVDKVYAHTFLFNRLYTRPILPLGQVYGHPSAGQIVRFRQLCRAYGAANVSWWDWQEAPAMAWRAISQPAAGVLGFSPYVALAQVRRGARSDLVVWAQEHLISTGQPLTVDGVYGAATASAVAAFQTAQGLPATGILDTPTWQALLRYRAARVLWVRRGSRLSATMASANRRMVVPRSAALPATRNEIPPSLGAGRPGR